MNRIGAATDSTRATAATTRTVDCCYQKRQADRAQDWSNANDQLSAATVTNDACIYATHINEIASKTWRRGHDPRLHMCTATSNVQN